MSDVLEIRSSASRRRRVIEATVLGIAGVAFVVLVARSFEGGLVRSVAVATALVTYLVALRVGHGRLLRSFTRDARPDFEIKLDREGVHLNTANQDAGEVVLGWDAVGAVVLAHVADPEAPGIEGVVFLPAKDPANKALPTFASGSIRSRTWTTGPDRRDAVRTVVAYLREHRPEIPVRETTIEPS
jgi:hypothetical protein